jgi:peptidoglycan/LPS O-acetylase OafA/YrhL
MASAIAAEVLRSRRHYEGLDALRGFAALMVLMHHIDVFYPTFFVFRHAYLGVDIFFMLSGFVIAHTYEGRLASGSISFPRYAKVRLMRLYPMIILAIGIGAAYALHVGMTVSAVLLLIAAQLFMIPMLGRGVDAFPLNTPQWSLLFELAVNALHALIARYLTTKRVVLITAGSGVIFAAIALYERTASLGFAGLMGFAGGGFRATFGFFAGQLIYRLVREQYLPSGTRFAWLAYPSVIGAMLLAGTQRNSLGAIADLVSIFLVFPISVWAVAGLTMRPLWRSIAKWGGAVSYPLYAVQQPVIEFVLLWLPKASDARPVAWVSLLIGLCLLAWLIELAIDAPLRRWLKPKNAVPREEAASAP